MESVANKTTCPKCPECGNASKKFGKHRNGLQRFCCRTCKKTFSDEHAPAFRIEDYLRTKQGCMAIRMLVEGCSVRTVERLTGIRRDTVIDLLLIAGERCEKLMNRMFQNLPLTDIQMDETWNFIWCKQKNVTIATEGIDYVGDNWNWVAIDRPTKLVVAFVCGARSTENAMELARKTRRATSPDVNIQITSDGLKSYLPAIAAHFPDSDYAQLVKVYGTADSEGQRRYSPAEVISSEKVPVRGNPDPAKICTSHVERQNLTMRMQMRRMTRLTNGFSKKMQNHKAAVALHFGWYNFCQQHGTLRVTPAMEAKVTDHIWSVEELLA